MTRLASTAAPHTRRGFMARAGKVVLGLGLTMVGAGRTPSPVRAIEGCPTECGDYGRACPPAPGCPPGCVATRTFYRCDAATGTCCLCQTCDCHPSGGRDCACAYDTGLPCGAPGSPC